MKKVGLIFLFFIVLGGFSFAHDRKPIERVRYEKARLNYWVKYKTDKKYTPVNERKNVERVIKHVRLKKTK